MSDPKDAIANAIDNAPEARRSTPAPANDAPPADGTAAAKKKRQYSRDVPHSLEFPEDCPIEPLGFNGDDVFFLDQARQLRCFKAKDLNQGVIRSLFGDMQDLKYTYWPRWSKPDADGDMKVIGVKWDQAADVLYAECRRRGQWDILDRVRGPGGWVDEDGQLVMHCGDLLYRGDQTLTPAMIGRHVYPSAPKKPYPDLKADGKKAAETLISMIRTWAWRKPDLDPELLMGWIAAAMLGGALDWRPLVWITGDKATGKSTLHKILKGVIGNGGLISATDASAAGLWQTVGHASLPVALDEIEAEADNRKASNIIKLARHAASGGQTLRGGSDHMSSSFTVRSCFIFSSILIPPMPAQDMSRMAILQLKELINDEGHPLPNLEPRKLAELGAAIRGRLIREWHRIPGQIEMWKRALALAGHDSRGGDQFGTLMALCDVLMNDHTPDENFMSYWLQLLDKKGMAYGDDEQADHERCVQHLLTSPCDFYRSGERHTIGQWIQQAAGRLKGKSSDDDKYEARRMLQNLGLLVQDKLTGSVPRAVLQVANNHQGLAAIYRDTHWGALSGTSGVWAQAFRRMKNASSDQQRFSGAKLRCTCVFIDDIFGGADEA